MARFFLINQGYDGACLSRDPVEFWVKDELLRGSQLLCFDVAVLADKDVLLQVEQLGCFQ
jgi:hypothetical protein